MNSEYGELKRAGLIVRAVGVWETVEQRRASMKAAIYIRSVFDQQTGDFDLAGRHG